MGFHYHIKGVKEAIAGPLPSTLKKLTDLICNYVNIYVIYFIFVYAGVCIRIIILHMQELVRLMIAVL